MQFKMGVLNGCCVGRVIYLLINRRVYMKKNKKPSLRNIQVRPSKLVLRKKNIAGTTGSIYTPKIRFPKN